MGKAIITIGKSLKKKTAGGARVILNKRYKNRSKEVDACIEKNFGQDKGAEKLNGNGNTSADKPKPSTAKK